MSKNQSPANFHSGLMDGFDPDAFDPHFGEIRKKHEGSLNHKIMHEIINAYRLKRTGASEFWNSLDWNPIREKVDDENLAVIYICLQKVFAILADEQRTDPATIIETEFSFSLHEYGFGYGIADAVIYNDHRLYVIDFKTGKNKVTGDDQLMLYACGICHALAKRAFFEEVGIVVIQPSRVKEQRYRRKRLSLKEVESHSEKLIRRNSILEIDRFRKERKSPFMRSGRNLGDGFFLKKIFVHGTEEYRWMIERPALCFSTEEEARKAVRILKDLEQEFVYRFYLGEEKQD